MRLLSYFEKCDVKYFREDTHKKSVFISGITFSINSIILFGIDKYWAGINTSCCRNIILQLQITRDRFNTAFLFKFFILFLSL